MKVSGKELNHLVSRELYLFQEISNYIDEIQVSDEGQIQFDITLLEPVHDRSGEE